MVAKLVAKTIDTDFSRIEFTPDLMPSDVLGTAIFDFKTSTFDFKKGPIFSNIVLIDEINRAPAKTQAALFEVMEERQVTIDGKLFKRSYMNKEGVKRSSTEIVANELFVHQKALQAA